MLVIRRLKLLSGVAGLLVFSMAATGCRSCKSDLCCSPCCPPSYTGACVDGVQAVSMGSPQPMPASACACTQAAQLGAPIASSGRPGQTATPVASTTYGRPGFPTKPLWRLSETRSEPKYNPPTHLAQCQPCQPRPQAQPSSAYAVSQPRQQTSSLLAACSTCIPLNRPAPSSCNSCSTLPTSSAIVLRPVPAGQPVSNDSGASEVRQVSSEAPPLADPVIQQVGKVDPTSLVSLLPPPASLGEPSSQPAPLLVLQDDSTRNEPIPPVKKDADKTDKGILPPPRMRNGNGTADKKAASNGATGWPELPAPTITNPPAAPREFHKHALSAYIIEPPDVLRIDGLPELFDKSLPLEGPHLVRPDGTIGLGTYGSVFVAGMTLDQAKMQIIQAIMRRQSSREPAPKGDKATNAPAAEPPTLQQFWEGIRVDVAAYNSKFYFVITDGGGYGETVVRLPCTGNETVLDAISQIQGLPAVASKKKIWVARATPDDHHQPIILPVDWYSITQRGGSATNYQLFPGDRVYVNSDCRIRLDSHLAKILSPVERLFGVTLLGATTVNTIRNNQPNVFNPF